MPKFKLTTFRADVTPPVGHPLCGGWYDRPAEGVTDPLFAVGIVFHLPGEPFIEYQLFAQQQRPDLFLAALGYGDCSTGYIPLARSYEEGGYEPTDAFVSPKSETLMRDAISKLLRK